MISRAKTVGRTTAWVARRMLSSTVSTFELIRDSASRARMASMITTPPSTMIPKSTAPMERRLALIPRRWR